MTAHKAVFPVSLHPLGLETDAAQREAIESEIKYLIRERVIPVEQLFNEPVIVHGIEFTGTCPHDKRVAYTVSAGYVPAPGHNALGLSCVSNLTRVLLTRAVSPDEYADDLLRVLCDPSEGSGIRSHGSVVRIVFLTSCPHCLKTREETAGAINRSIAVDPFSTHASLQARMTNFLRSVEEQDATFNHAPVEKKEAVYHV